MKRAWIACLVVAIISSFVVSNPAYAARKHNVPNPIGTVLTFVMVPVANTIDGSREVIGFEAESDYITYEEQPVTAEMVDLWGRQSSRDVLDAMGVKFTVVN